MNAFLLDVSTINLLTSVCHFFSPYHYYEFYASCSVSKYVTQVPLCFVLQSCLENIWFYNHETSEMITFYKNRDRIKDLNLVKNKSHRSLIICWTRRSMPTSSPAAKVWTGSGGQGLATAAICRAIRVTEGRRGEWFTSAGLQTAGIAYRRGRRGMRAVAGSCGCKHCSTHSAGYTTHHISSRSWCEQGQVITNTLWAVYTIGLTFQNITQVQMY